MTKVARLGQSRGLRVVLAPLAVAAMLVPFGAIGAISAIAQPAGAATTCGDGGNFGAQLLGTSWPGGFAGVPVYSNGSNSEFVGSCSNSTTTPSGKVVATGTEWQCVELVNRLYLSKGWISTRWVGNGNSMYSTAPSNFQKQAQGSITHLSPGDVVSVNLYDGKTAEPGGHVLIVSAVKGSTVTYVSQNAGSNTTSTATTTGQLTNGTLTVKASGSWTYPVIGVVHAPGNGQDDLLYQDPGSSTFYMLSNIGGSVSLSTVVTGWEQPAWEVALASP